MLEMGGQARLKNRPTQISCSTHPVTHSKLASTYVQIIIGYLLVIYVGQQINVILKWLKDHQQTHVLAALHHKHIG